MAKKQAALLTREQILNTPVELATRRINVPSWGGDLILRELTANERDEYDDKFIAGKGRKSHINLKFSRARLLSLSIVGEDGKHLFQAGDILTLGSKGSKTVSELAKMCEELSGLSEDDVENEVEN